MVTDPSAFRTYFVHTVLDPASKQTLQLSMALKQHVWPEYEKERQIVWFTVKI